MYPEWPSSLWCKLDDTYVRSSISQPFYQCMIDNISRRGFPCLSVWRIIIDRKCGSYWPCDLRSWRVVNGVNCDPICSTCVARVSFWIWGERRWGMMWGWSLLPYTYYRTSWRDLPHIWPIWCRRRYVCLHSHRGWRNRRSIAWIGIHQSRGNRIFGGRVGRGFLSWLNRWFVDWLINS
jgi:hypothetical protein